MASSAPIARASSWIRARRFRFFHARNGSRSVLRSAACRGFLPCSDGSSLWISAARKVLELGFFAEGAVGSYPRVLSFRQLGWSLLAGSPGYLVNCHGQHLVRIRSIRYLILLQYTHQLTALQIKMFLNPTSLSLIRTKLCVM